MNTLLSNFRGVLKNFKTSSFINILGLSAALVVFFLVLMQTHYDLTYDKGYTTSNELFQYNRFDGNTGEVNSIINFQIPATIKEIVPEAKAYCMLGGGGENSFDVERTAGSMPDNYKVPYFRTTSGFNEVFAPEIILGDMTGIFDARGKAMISQETAQLMFPNEDPIGKSIRFHFGGDVLTVQAVYKDFPKNSTLNNGVYTYLPEFEASEWSFLSFFLVNSKQVKTANEKIKENLDKLFGEGYKEYKEEHPEDKTTMRLSPMNELYLYSGGKGGSKRINTTISLLMIGVLTLAIAFVNFVNLSLAMAPSRVRSINIRKILGVDKLSLQLTIAMESVIFTLVAIGVALLGVYFIKGTTLAQAMFTTDLSLSSHIGLLVVASIGVLLLAFLLGLYTMRYSTSFDEAEALKGSFALGAQGVKLRNILIVLQFTTAIALICVSTFIKQQNDYMMSFDWGIPKENIVYLPLAELGQNSQAFGQELLRDPRVKDYSLTRALPGNVGMTWGRNYEGKQISLYVWSVDDRFFDFFEVDILHGRKPESMDSVVSQIVVNEEFLRKYEFDETLVGKDFPAFGPGRVQAIAKDINFQSLHQSIVPMAFGVLSQWNNFSYFLVKLTGDDIPGTLAFIEQTWNKFSKDPFEVHFLDESMDKLYRQESNMAKMIGIFGLIIVIIAVMGVYGLIVFNAKYKRKEIAIRKVNGSTEQEIMLNLNRTVLIQLGIAFIIAVPIAHTAASKWLENFAYRINIHWWVFLLGGIIVLLITLFTVSWQSYKAATTNPTEVLNKE